MGSLTNDRESARKTAARERALTKPGNYRDIEDRLDLNSGKEWSEMDLFDLANCVRLKDPVEEIASFLCRSRREVREKIAELDRSGELAKRIEETAANGLPE
jgi:hypothetical protein